MSRNADSLGRRKKKKWPWILLIIILLLGALVFWRYWTDKQNSTPADAVSADAAYGSVTTTVVGTGSLAEAEAEDITLLTGVKINETLVEAGDYVTAGDGVLTVDSLSVLEAIADTQSRLTALDTQLASADKTGDTAVRSLVSGRVKIIYAEKDQPVSEVVSANGALLVLSVDEKMAVNVPASDALKEGDQVSVQVSSGRKYTGNVESIENGEAVITLTDNGPKYGENADVSLKNGTLLGSGALYIHQPLSVLASEGKIKSVNVSENQQVDMRKELITLKDLPTTAAYKQLLSDRAEAEERLVTLLALSKDNTLYAEQSGRVSLLTVEAGDVTASADGGDAVIGALIPQEEMLVQVQIDELDILSVSLGQTASVTLDAAEGETFTGLITDIAHTSSLSSAASSVAKYTVEITLSRTEGMRQGMSATATISTETRENVLLVPTASLQEYGASIFVYTSFDTETGLGDKVTVITGLSDGTYTEILSGLSAGQTVYYQQTAYQDGISKLLTMGYGRSNDRFQSGD